MCVGEAAAHGAKRPHEREVLFDELFLLPIGGEKNLKGMAEAAADHGAKRPHAREVLFDELSLLPMGGEKNLGVWLRLLSMGQESAYQRGQYHASCEWVDPLTGLCGSMVYL